MVSIIVGQVLAVSALAVVGLMVQRALRIELTLACLLVGFVAGLGIEFTSFDTGIRASNLHDLVFFVILPVLIFEAAWELKPALLKKWLLPILLMATLGVLICTFIAAGLIYAGIGHAEGFPWIAALITGAILAATDPVAVIAQLRAAKVSADLTTIFEGESLFNDATAVVLFSIVIGLATNSVDAAGDSYFAYFFMVAVGGLVFGTVSGLVVSAVLLLIGSSVASRFILVFFSLCQLLCRRTPNAYLRYFGSDDDSYRYAGYVARSPSFGYRRYCGHMGVVGNLF